MNICISGKEYDFTNYSDYDRAYDEAACAGSRRVPYKNELAEGSTSKALEFLIEGLESEELEDSGNVYLKVETGGLPVMFCFSVLTEDAVPELVFTGVDTFDY